MMQADLRVTITPSPSQLSVEAAQEAPGGTPVGGYTTANLLRPGVVELKGLFSRLRRKAIQRRQKATDQCLAATSFPEGRLT